MQSSKRRQRREIAAAFQKAGPFLSIAYAFFGGILFLGYIGYRLDLKFGKSPLFIVTGVFAGFILGFYRLIKVVNELEKDRKHD